MKRSVRCLAALFGLAAALAGAHAAPPARGLIVKLKDAPSHEAGLSREAAQALGGDADSTMRAAGAPAQQNMRWQRVLSGAGVAPLRLKPTGRAAQLLEFDRWLPGDEAERLAAALRKRPEVEWVVPNERERRQQATPNDPGFRDARGTAFGQWWLYPVSGSDQNAIEDRLRGVPGFQSAWAISTGLAAARVAVLDTGITAHPDLTGRVLPGYDFVTDTNYSNDGDGRDADPSDPGDWVESADLSNPAFSGCVEENSSWHGTVIAGQIAAVTNGGGSVAGVSWDGRIVPVRVAGKCGAEVADIVDGMRWAAGLAVAGAPVNANPARIVNISFGGSAPCNAAYQDAIDDLLVAGAIVVAAAGNEHGAPTRPASCKTVVGVAALNRDGFKASYSNFGPTLAIATVGGDAPEEGNWGSYVGDTGLLTVDNQGVQQPVQADYSYLFGTSFAAPLVSGAASLMLSVNPQLSAVELIAGLRASARPHVVSDSIGVCSDADPGRCLCTTSTCGAGILDVTRALQVAQGLTPSALSPVLINNEDVREAAKLGPDLPPNAGGGDGGTGGGSGGDDGDDGGGGGLGAGWLAGLALAVLALARQRRRQRV